MITANGHGLNTGDFVAVGGVLGNTAANNPGFINPVTVINGNQFSINGSNGNGAYLGSGTVQRFVPVSGATNASPIVITANAHGFANGDRVSLFSVTGNTAANNTFLISGVTANTFQLTGSTGNGAYGGGGFVSLSDNVPLKSAIGAANRSGLNATDAAFNAFTNIPYVLNTVDTQRMLIGLNGLYEDADTTAANGLAGDVITQLSGANGLPAAVGVSALVYGGRRASADRVNVAYVGTNNGTIYVRGEAPATGFTSQNVGGGNTIRAIVVDPEDWMTAFAVTSNSNQIFMTTDGGATAWTNVTANLGTLTGALRSVAYVPTAGSDYVLASGLGGVFRAELDGTLPLEWSELDPGLPNTVSRDLHYDATDDTLILGTYGRGAWTLPNASTLVSAQNVLQIIGDMDAADQYDVFTISIDPNDSTRVNILVNGHQFGPYPLSQIDSIAIDGLGGDDTLTVDYLNGNPIPAGGVNFDGGGQGAGGGDTLIVNDGTFTTINSSFTNAHDGNIDLDGSVITYTGLEPVLLNVGTVANTIFNLPAGPNTDVVLADDTVANFPANGLNAANTSAINGSTFEYTSFTNPTNSLTVNLGAAGDTIDLREMDATFAPGGNPGMIVNGGTGADTINVIATDADVLETELNLGDGDDIVNINDGADTANGVVSPIDLNSGDGDDTLNLVDTAETDDSRLFHINATMIGGGDFGAAVTPGGVFGDGGLLTYDTSLEHLDVDGPDGANVDQTYNIDGTGLNAGLGTVVFSEDFEGGLGGFVIDNTFGNGDGLWHRSTGRRLDGLANHSPDFNLYYGQAEDDFNGGNFNTGGANEGVVISPVIAIPAGASTLAVIDVLNGGVTTLGTVNNNAGVWESATFDLTPFAGTSVELRFRFNATDGVLNNGEGWFIDDVEISNLTPGVNTVVIDDGQGNGTFNIQADDLGAGGDINFNGNTGDETFNLFFSTNASIGTSTDVSINGGGPASDSENRDVVNLITSADVNP